MTDQMNYDDEHGQLTEEEPVFFYAGMDWSGILRSIGEEQFKKQVKLYFEDIYNALQN